MNILVGGVVCLNPMLLHSLQKNSARHYTIQILMSKSTFLSIGGFECADIAIRDYDLRRYIVRLPLPSCR